MAEAKECRTTLLAGGVIGFRDGIAKDAMMDWPESACLDQAGNVIFADRDNFSIRLFDVKTHAVSTLAGNGSSELVDDCSSDVAQFEMPTAVACDEEGTVYISDYSCHRIGKEEGCRDGDCRETLLSCPDGLCLWRGYLFVCDRGNNRIRCIDLKQQMVTTLAGSESGFRDGMLRDSLFSAPAAVVIDSQSRMYIADQGNRRLRCFDMEWMLGNDSLLQLQAIQPVLGLPQPLLKLIIRLTVGLREECEVTSIGDGVERSMDGHYRDVISFGHPCALACDDRDNLLVADRPSLFGRGVLRFVGTAAQTVSTLQLDDREFNARCAVWTSKGWIGVCTRTIALLHM